ncbi:MAG: ABC transporter permease [Demequina sp.]|uniref:ABC transporter permease n=1 Tax=Demequina sp. TaxID=2050685 RepID=UPI003A8B4490
MTAAFVSEYRKIATTRLWWVLLICMIAGAGFMAGVVAFSFAFADDLGGEAAVPAGMDPRAMAMTIYGLAVSFGYVFPAILGALAVTGEMRHRTIDTTLLADPHRGRIIGAKLAAVAPFAALFGIAGMAAAVATGAAGLALADSPTYLDDPATWGSIGMGVVALTTWGLVGVGLGAAVPHQVVVIVALIGWTQLVEPVLRLVLSLIEPLAGMAAYLPGAAGDAMVGASFYSSTGSAGLLSPWAGFGVLLAYGAIAAVVGWLVTFRRDLS